MQRRHFLSSAGSVAAALAFPAIARSQTPNSNVRVAVVGASRTLTGGPGHGAELALALASMPQVELAYICEVESDFLAKALAEVAQKGARPKGEPDFRRALEDKNVDAVVLATPDHWHTPGTLLAAAAGKHVYVETPCSHQPDEGEWLAASAARHGRLIQHGTHRRSWPVLQEAITKLKEGAIGHLFSAKALYFNNRLSIGAGKNAAVPRTLDWSLWQGPAPEKPFHDNYVPYNWHWFWHWGTGELGNTGLPLLDLCRWGMGLDVPNRTTSGGAKVRFRDDQETPDAQVTTFDFVGREGIQTITWEARSWAARTLNDPKYDVAFYGEGGSLLISGSAYHVYDLQGKETARGVGAGGHEPHLRNFTDAIRGQGQLHAEIADGAQSALLCHLGNIAWRTSRPVMLDPKTRRPAEDPLVRKLWSREYREGWTPVV